MTSHNSFMESLPKKRMGAGCLFFDELMFIFDGGVLTSQEIHSIKLRRDELSDYSFFTAESLPTEMTKSLRDRVLASWQQVSTGKGVYLEDQQML